MRCEIDAVRLQKRGFRSVRNIARSVWYHDAAYVESGLRTCRTADRYDTYGRSSRVTSTERVFVGRCRGDAGP